LLRSNRGNALVLAVLIVLLLTSVGVVSVQRTSTDLIVSGNITRSTQAFIGSDICMQHALKLVGVGTEGYMLAVAHQKGQAHARINNDVTYGIVDVTTAAKVTPPPIPAPDPKDPRPENLWLKTVSGTDKARTLQDIACHATATWIRENPGLAGYSKDADLCHQVYDFNSQAGIPDRVQSAADTTASKNTLVVTSRARALTGPSKCQLPQN
jgi:hypothetical protein